MCSRCPGLLIVPLVFFYAGTTSLELAKWGMFLAGFFTVAQFSFWGNYLPRVYPTHLRGTGEGFAANIGGRMLGHGLRLRDDAVDQRHARCNAARPTRVFGGARRVFRLPRRASSRAGGCPEPKGDHLPE